MAHNPLEANPDVVQGRVPPLQVNVISAGEPPAVRNKNVTATDVRNEEAALRALLENKPGLENLFKRFNEDIDLFQNRKTGIARLDDRLKDVLLADDSKGLVDRQNKTQAFFQQALAQSQLEEEQKQAIQKKLQDLHQTRSDFLTKRLNEENSRQMQRSFLNVLEAFGQNPPDDVTSYVEGDTPPLVKYLNDRGLTGLTDPKTGRYFQIRGDTITTNYPQAYGDIAKSSDSVPEGKTLYLSGRNPLKVIQAGIAALQSGINNVDISSIEKMVFERKGVYKSEAERAKAIHLYRVFQKMQAARLAARADQPNYIFNENPRGTFIAQKAQEFNSIGPAESSAARRDLILSVPFSDRAQFAVEADKGKPPEHQDAHNYIRPYTHDGRSTEWFEIQYANGIVDAGFEKFQNMTQEQIVDYISSHNNAHVRAEFYKRLNVFVPDRNIVSPDQVPNFRNGLKAMLVSRIIDRSLVSSIDPSTGKSKMSTQVEAMNKNELKLLLKTCKETDRQTVQAMVEGNVNRLHNKAANYNNDLQAQLTRNNTPAAQIMQRQFDINHPQSFHAQMSNVANRTRGAENFFYNQPEIANKQNLINSQDKVDAYTQLYKSVSVVMNEITQAEQREFRSEPPLAAEEMELEGAEKRAGEKKRSDELVEEGEEEEQRLNRKRQREEDDLNQPPPPPPWSEDNEAPPPPPSDKTTQPVVEEGAKVAAESTASEELPEEESIFRAYIPKPPGS